MCVCVWKKKEVVPERLKYLTSRREGSESQMVLISINAGGISTYLMLCVCVNLYDVFLGVFGRRSENGLLGPRELRMKLSDKFNLNFVYLIFSYSCLGSLILMHVLC